MTSRALRADLFPRAIIGVVLGLVARLWLATLRVHLELHADLEAVQDRPWILSFFHGTQWPLLAWKRRRPTLVMVSHSIDGSIQARALASLGFRVVRGSSSRGGAGALAAMIRRLRRGDVDAAFAVDGPRGPYGDVKAGALLAAQRASGVLVPMGSAIERGKIFDRAWDRFALAWPFARVTIVLGAPSIADGSTPASLAESIRAANGRAGDLLAGEGRRATSRARSRRSRRARPWAAP